MKQVLCFGDSNTWGLIPATTERYDWDTRWTEITGNKLMQDGYRVIEEGLCGRKTVFDDPLRIGRRGTEMLPVLLETHKPVDIIVLMLGQIRDTVPYAKPSKEDREHMDKDGHKALAEALIKELEKIIAN